MKFGIDRTDITPDWPVYLSGYDLQDVSDGVNDPLTFTSLVLEEKGRRVMIGAVDLCSLGRVHSGRLRRRIAQRLGTGLADVMINCSHTHGGMLVSDLSFPENPAMREQRRKNRRLLEKRVMASVDRAAARLAPGKLFYGEGTTSIPLNRRLLYRGVLDNRPNPSGKVDRSLKILRITDEKGKIAVVLARVSCHPVATGARHLVTADFPGAYRAELEKYFPGATAVFLQGAGADARPRQVARGDEWFALAHADLPVIGQCLAGEVVEVLAGRRMTSLDRITFGSALEVAELPVVDPRVTRDQLRLQLEMEYVPEEAWKKARIERILGSRKIRTSLPVSVQMISFGPRFSILGIEAEVLCALGEKIGRALSTDFGMVLGYANGARCYLPDREEYARGGYEVDAYLLDMLPSPLSPDLEDILAGRAADFDRRLNRPQKSG